MIANQMIIGTSLPELSNPATAENLAAGKQAIDSSGEIITGTAEVCDMLANLGTATAADVTNGKTFTSVAGQLVAGTGNFSDIVKGTVSTVQNKILEIPGAKGKENIIVMSAYNIQSNFIDCVIKTTYMNWAHCTGNTVGPISFASYLKWNKDAATMTMSSGYAGVFNPNYTYNFMAW